VIMTVSRQWTSRCGRNKSSDVLLTGKTNVWGLSTIIITLATAIVQRAA